MKKVTAKKSCSVRGKNGRFVCKKNVKKVLTEDGISKKLKTKRGRKDLADKMVEGYMNYKQPIITTTTTTPAKDAMSPEEIQRIKNIELENSKPLLWQNYVRKVPQDAPLKTKQFEDLPKGAFEHMYPKTESDEIAKALFEVEELPQWAFPRYPKDPQSRATNSRSKILDLEAIKKSEDKILKVKEEFALYDRNRRDTMNKLGQIALQSTCNTSSCMTDIFALNLKKSLGYISPELASLREEISILQEQSNKEISGICADASYIKAEKKLVKKAKKILKKFKKKFYKKSKKRYGKKIAKLLMRRTFAIVRESYEDVWKFPSVFTNKELERKMEECNMLETKLEESNKKIDEEISEVTNNLPRVSGQDLGIADRSNLSNHRKQELPMDDFLKKGIDVRDLVEDSSASTSTSSEEYEMEVCDLQDLADKMP